MLRRALVTAAVAVVPFLTAIPPAQAATGTVVPVRITGDPAKRFNIVIVGDGYTAAEMPKFLDHVDRHMNVMLSLEPFKSYRSYLNIYAVEVPSQVSGVSCDPNLTSPRRDTPLHMGFWGGCDANSVQRLLTVDNTALTQYANLVPGTNSSNRQLLAIGNSDTYGGAGGTYATASGGNALSALITPHELGHSLGGLQDEYDYLTRGVRGGAYTDGEPNSAHHTLLTEQQMRDQHAKWWRWLGEPSLSGGTIGRYESGMYDSTGVWRPSAHSMMKTLGYYFDQVSREVMTQRLSGKTNILPDSTPTTAPIGADRVVWLEPLHPTSHALDVTWKLDGAPLPTTTPTTNATTSTPNGTSLPRTNSDPLPTTGTTTSPATNNTTTSSTNSSTPTANAPTPATNNTPASTNATTAVDGTSLPRADSDSTTAATSHPSTDASAGGTSFPTSDSVPGLTTSSTPLPNVGASNGSRSVDLAALHLSPGRHTLAATVVDNTDFVRDPAIRGTSALTRTRAWTVDTTVTTPRTPVTPNFTSATPTDRPISGHEVVYAETTHPVDQVIPVSWAVDGTSVPTPGNDRDLDLNRLRLKGTHTLTASIPGHTLTWRIDATDPAPAYQLSPPVSKVEKPGQPPEYIYNAPFTMKLTATDDTAGNSITEFRTDGDGWFNYFGWPTNAASPWLFTANGTVIDNLVYGKLGTPRLSPWDNPPAGYGTHTVDYRAADPTGNISAAGTFKVTLLKPPPTCTTTVNGVHKGSLVIRSGVTCLSNAEFTGPITVLPGASLVVTDSTVNGPVSSANATTVELLNTVVHGPVALAGTTDTLTIAGGRIDGPTAFPGHPREYFCEY